jgi:hypothetical protein
LLEKSAARAGVEIVRYGEGQPWPMDYRVGKLVAGIECVKSLPEDVTHVMFLDCSDSLILAGPEEIVAQFEAYDLGVSLIIQGEKNCYPDSTLEASYPPADTPWHFVNSGGWIARKEVALKNMQMAADMATYCDQLCWTKLYLSGKGDVNVDQQCRIFQSMYLQQPGELQLVDGRFWNTVTRQAPCVAHWNGTKNAGTPFSRNGVWEAMTGEKPPQPAQKARESICICMPGSSFSNTWMMGWTELYSNLSQRFDLGLFFCEGNNIYLVRENCIRFALGGDRAPDYILWIDSDNPPSAEGFEWLYQSIKAAPEVSVIGGWYRFALATQEVRIAAGVHGNRFQNVPEDQIRSSENLIEVDFIGFGFCLMRTKVIQDIGVDKCFEPYLYPEPCPVTGRTWATDDDGFGIRAREAGHRIFLHPKVFLEHEKRMTVPASFELRNEIQQLKEV